MIHIDIDLVPKLNLADFQNSVSVLRSLSLTNQSDATVDGLRVTLTSEPPFFRTRHWHLEELASGEICEFKDLELALDGSMLWKLTEAEIAIVEIRVEQPERDNCEPVVTQTTVELLPKNQWGGLAAMPEMVAAFVQPNAPAIDALLGRAAEQLRSHGCNPAFNGYESGGQWGLPDLAHFSQA